LTLDEDRDQAKAPFEVATPECNVAQKSRFGDLDWLAKSTLVALDVLFKGCVAEGDAFLKVNVRENKRPFKAAGKENGICERSELHVQSRKYSILSVSRKEGNHAGP
jgi:hypothetical protein